MAESNQNSTVLVVTEDIELLSSLLENNTTEFQFNSRETIQTVLDEPDLLDNNHIAIIDIDNINGGASNVIEQTLKLKKSDPTQVIMMVGNPDELGELLRSNIQPIIYRAFNKPISPNQIFLAFRSASTLHKELLQKQADGEDLLSIGPIENSTNIDSLAEQQKNKPAIYAGIGLLALGVIAWLLLSGDSDSNKQTQTRLTTTTAPASQEANLNTTDDNVSQVNYLNQEAAKALLEGRQISPPNDNALHYYDQVLAIDPYDLTAYEGKKSLVLNLKESYSSLVANAEFDQALNTLNALQVIEPLDTSNYELRESLEVTISEYVKKIKDTGTAEEIEQTSIALQKLGSQSASSKSAAAALQNEKRLLETIDKAIEENNLIPPQSGNAYAIVSDALQKNTISKVNFAPRISALSNKLVISASNALDADNIEEAEKFTSLVKRLDVDPENLAQLESRLQEKKDTIAEATAEKVEEVAEEEPIEEIAPKVAKIIPAKIISRAAPKYPSRALSRDVEGWVSISFKIDTDGIPKEIAVVDSEPSATFDNAAISAVKKWRFSPAMNDETKEAVESYVESTKLQFTIDK